MFLYVDDGSHPLSDMALYPGVKVGPIISTALPGSYVSATGIATTEAFGFIEISKLTTRSAEDVVVIIPANPPDPGSNSDPRAALAQSIINSSGITRSVTTEVDQSISDPEGFRIQSAGGSIAISGGSQAGILYAAQELARRAGEGPLPSNLDIAEAPDFAVRGTSLFVMKNGIYNIPLNRTQFPWFYDQPLLTSYLDYLFQNRFNTIFIWSGFLFPNLVSLPAYPNCADVSESQVLENQAQLRWFTTECEKRNIKVLLHFYQIEIPGTLAKRVGISHVLNEPTPFLRQYVKYALTTFLMTFDSVGLYVCPGEAMYPYHQPDWFNNVIFQAAKDSGENPLIVIRDWCLDAQMFVQKIMPNYSNLYTERKHNCEMLVSPVTDYGHSNWTSLTGNNHLVNLHEIADVKPFRWGSQAFVREMISQWRTQGIDGAEVYNMVSWRWPYSLDKLMPGQIGYWPWGPKLLTFERDAIWLQEIGRYLWDIDRDAESEAAYWDANLASKFGSAAAGNLIRRWYDVTGPILPGLQNLTAVFNMNTYPTVVGKEQTVDNIIKARVGPNSTQWPISNYPSMPVDSYFFNRYKSTYNEPTLTNRVSMPVEYFADEVAAGRPITGLMTPDRICAVLVEMAQEGLHLAQEARAAATTNLGELDRFISDSQAIVLISQIWSDKVNAAIQKRLFWRVGNQQYEDSCLLYLQDAVGKYQSLVTLTDSTYLAATDFFTSFNWHNGLTAHQNDLIENQNYFNSVRLSRSMPGDPCEFWVIGDVGTTKETLFHVPAGWNVVSAILKYKATDMDGNNPGDEGVFRIGGHQFLIPNTGDGQTKQFEQTIDPSYLTTGSNIVQFVLVAKPGGTSGYRINNLTLNLVLSPQ